MMTTDLTMLAATAVTTTCAPARVKQRTPAAPMPEPPPVTTHTRFCRFMRPA
jgi:hypothetical protein